MILSRLSIRVRITLGTFLLAAAFFAGSAILVHRQVESVLDDASVAVLRSDTSPYRVALRDEPGDQLDSPGEDELVAVVDPAGTVRLNSFPRSLTARFIAIDLSDDHSQLISADGLSYLVLVTHEKTSTGTWAVIAARTEAASRLVLDTLTRGLIIGLIVLTLLFTLASWLLTGAALRPITALRRSADELASSGDVGLLPVPESRDEVHDLATTLNTLIGDLRDSANRERQLVSDASHELRTPLAILQSQLELMRGGDAVKMDEDIVSALGATSRMSNLVTELLELSRVEAMATSGSSDLPQLADELADAVDRARFGARTEPVTVDFSSSGTGGRFAIGAHEFGRVVDNLVRNAIKAGSTDVTVSMEAHTERLLLTVADNGPGIPEDFIPRAFDRFSQPDDGRESGTGLGLAIVAAIVAASNGTVTLENSGAGAHAIVMIPAAP